MKKQVTFDNAKAVNVYTTETLIGKAVDQLVNDKRLLYNRNYIHHDVDTIIGLRLSHTKYWAEAHKNVFIPSRELVAFNKGKLASEIVYFHKHSCEYIG